MADTKISADSAQATLASAFMAGIDGTPTNKKFPGYAFWGEKGADVASAGTLVLGDDGDYFHITGTTTITDIDFTTAKDGRHAMLEFDGALTLTHNATTLNLPGGANIVTEAGDRAIIAQDSGDNVHMVVYVRKSGGLLFQSGSAPAYGVRAWVNFNGSGTVAIRASGNVTSITDNGVGDYTVNFTTALADANYAIWATGSPDSGVTVNGFVEKSRVDTQAQTSSACRLTCLTTAGGTFDPVQVNFGAIR